MPKLPAALHTSAIVDAFGCAEMGPTGEAGTVRVRTSPRQQTAPEV
jgi:hypothetical protein